MIVLQFELWISVVWHKKNCTDRISLYFDYLTSLTFYRTEFPPYPLLPRASTESTVQKYSNALTLVYITYTDHVMEKLIDDPTVTMIQTSAAKKPGPI